MTDEPDHYAYVQQLATSGTLPSADAQLEFTNEEIFALNALHQGTVQFRPQVLAIASVHEQQVLDKALHTAPGPSQNVNAGDAGGEPPLYYALEAIPYTLASGGTVLDRLQLMRLFSAMLAGLTALFCFLFIREVAPSVKSAAPVGALCIALMPLLGYISGAVNPEALLIPVAAASFYFLAHAFRRGFSTMAAVRLGLVIAVGFLTKLNFLGIAPGMLIGLFVLAWLAARSSRAAAMKSLSIALSLACTPAVLYVVINLVDSHQTLGQASAVSWVFDYSALHELSYIWQFFLPRLPGMKDYFPGISTTRQLWFNGLIGLYGWVDTRFPEWVYTLALIPTGIILAMCARALTLGRHSVRRHLPEVGVYVLMAGGLLTLIGATSYFSQYALGTAPWLEPRYLLPLSPIAALVIALAPDGAGRRLKPIVGVVLVVLFLGWDLFSQLQVAARFYG